MSYAAAQSGLHVQRVRVDQQVADVIALTSLLAEAEGSVLVGATSTRSEQPVLLRFDPAARTVHDTGLRFPAKGEPGSYAQSVGDKIHDALIHGNGPWAGWCLLGHGSHIWWDEGGWPFNPATFPGGGLYAWHPTTAEARLLAVPVANNTVHGLYGGDGFAVGYSLPDNHFFAFDYATGDAIDLGRISAYCCHSFVCHGRRAFGVYRRSIGEQRGDLVVTADAAAFLMVYDHDTRRLERTDILISELSANIRFNSGVDSWTVLGDVIVGGRVDGTLFALDPDRLTIRELGYAIEPTRPALDAEQVRRLGGRQCREILGCERITAMMPLDEHRLVGTAGFPAMHLFILDLHTGQRTDLGPVNPDAQMCYFHDLAIVPRADGGRGLVLAETDSAHADLYVVHDADGELFGHSTSPKRQPAALPGDA